MTLRCRLLPPVVRGPLVADERGESARLVRFVRRLDGLAPGLAIRGVPEGEAFREWPLREADDDVDRRFGALARLDHVVPFAALRVGEQLRIAAEQLREKAHAVGVIGDHQEIERTGQLHALAARSGDLLSLGEAIGILRAEPRAERARVHRKRRVRGVAEERARRKVASRVGRVRRLARECLSAVALSSVPMSVVVS